MNRHYEDLLSQVNMLEVFKARRVVEQRLKPTHMTYYKRLSDELGTHMYVKHATSFSAVLSGCCR